MTELPNLKSRTPRSRLNSGWVGLKLVFPEHKRKVIWWESLYLRALRKRFGRSTLSAPLWALLPWYPHLPFWGIQPQGSWGPSPLTVCSCFLPLPAVTLSLEGTREDILLLYPLDVQVQPDGPDKWTSAFVTSKEEITSSKKLHLLLNSFDFSKFFTKSTPPDSWGSRLLRVPLCYSAAKSSTWESIPYTHTSQTLMCL